MAAASKLRQFQLHDPFRYSPGMDTIPEQKSEAENLLTPAKQREIANANTDEFLEGEDPSKAFYVIPPTQRQTLPC